MQFVWHRRHLGTPFIPASLGSCNLFANPTAVYHSYAPILLRRVTSGNFSGNLRGMARWNLDRDMVSTTAALQMFNVFNHVQLVDPTRSLQSQQTRGVLGTQLNQPRVIERGLNIDFS